MEEKQVLSAFADIASRLLKSIDQYGVNRNDAVRTNKLMHLLGDPSYVTPEEKFTSGTITLAQRMEAIRAYKIFFAKDAANPILPQLISFVHSTLEVKPSTIEGAGMGLFAKRTIEPSGDLPVTLYGGIRMSEHFYASNHMEQGSEYMVEFPGEKNGFIDGKTCFKLGIELGRWINHKLDPDERNCEFHYNKEKDVLEVYATKQIEKGGELFITYGDKYFKKGEERIECAFCQAEQPAFTCENCPETFYCDAECQKAHFEYHTCGDNLLSKWFRKAKKGNPLPINQDINLMLGTGEQYVPTVYLGGKSAVNEAYYLGAIVSVVDPSRGGESQHNIEGRFSKNHAHLYVPIQEGNPNYNITPWFDVVATWIADQMRLKRKLLIYSFDGKSSSVVLLMYYMVKYKILKSADEALAYIKARRPQVDPSPEFMLQLRQALK